MRKICQDLEIRTKQKRKKNAFILRRFKVWRVFLCVEKCFILSRKQKAFIFVRASKDENNALRDSKRMKFSNS